MNFFFLDNFLKIENTNLKFYNIADILIYNISVSSLLSVDIIDNILQITTKNSEVYKLEFMDINQLLSAKQIILGIINGNYNYVDVKGKYRDLSTYYTLSGFIDTAYSGSNILRLKDKSNISKYLLLMNTIRSTTVQNHILVISMYDKSIPLRFLTHGDAKNAKIVLDDYILNNSDPGGGGGGTITNHSQLVLNDGTNPHGTTKSDVGLGNVDNTSDINKPISIATQNVLDDKVDKVPGMGLSQENFTTSLKDKLDGIETGAEVNVQADWAQSDNTADDYIKNKPTIPTVLNNHSQLTLDDGTNPHGTTKSDVGLGNVDNTSDINKPISNATQNVLDDKVDKIPGKGLSQEDFTTSYKDILDNQSGINSGDETTSSIQTKRPIKTVNGESLEGNGNLQIDYNDLDNLPTLISNHSGLNLDDGTNPHGTTKSDVGLGNVDNTSDIDKPISNATQNVLDNKVDKILGMGLSQENFTTTLKDKLDGIEVGAEVNVQSDWNQTNNTLDDFIKNKPVNLSDFNNDGEFGTDRFIEEQDVLDRLLRKQNLPTGFITGLELSIKPGDPTKAIIGTGIYAITDFTDIVNIQVQLIQVTTPIEFTPQYLTTNPASYVALDINMNVIQSSSPFDNDDRRTLALIGATIHSNLTIINVVNQIKAPIIAPTNQLHDLIEAVGSLNLEGNIYVPNGNNLQINKSAGIIWGLGINAQNYLDPHRLFIPTQTALTFRYRLRDTTLLNGESSDVNLIDPDHYDNSGVKTIVPNNRFTIQRINLFQSGLTRIQYGQHQYNSLEEAEQKIKTESFTTETNIADNAIFRCYLIIKKNATDLSDIAQAKFITVDKWGNALSGGVALTYDSIITALGFTPEDVTNKTDVIGTGNTTNYPSTKGVADYVSDVEDNLVGYINSGLDMKQDVLTAFNVGEFMDNELPTKLTPSSNDTLLARDSITNEAVEISLNSLLPNSEIDDRQLQRYWYSMTANTLNTTLMLVNNTNFFTVSGTASVVSRVGTTYYNSIAMNNYLSATANGSNCGIKNSNQGDGSYLEGFDSSFVFINNDTNVNCETTVGYYGLLSAIPNIPKSAYNTDFVGVGNDVGDMNLSFFCKRNTETPSYTKVDCGSDFPAHTTIDAYVLRMQMSRGFNNSGRTLKMTITNIITGAVFSHTFTDSQIPSHSRNIAMVVNRSNRNTGVATNIRFSKWHQTKYLY